MTDEQKLAKEVLGLFKKYFGEDSDIWHTYDNWDGESQGKRLKRIHKLATKINEKTNDTIRTKTTGTID